MQHFTPYLEELRLRHGGVFRVNGADYDVLVGVDTASNTLRLEVPVPSPDSEVRAVVETPLHRAANSDRYLADAVYRVLAAAHRLSSLNGSSRSTRHKRRTFSVKEKVTQYMLVTADGVPQAHERIQENLSNMLVSFQVPDVVETKIVDVFPYENVD